MSWASSSFAPPSPSPRHMRPLHSFPLHTAHLAQALSLTSVGTSLGPSLSSGVLLVLWPPLVSPLTLKQYFLMTPLPASLLICFLGSCQKTPAALISACPSFSVDSFQRISHPILPTHCLLGWRNFFSSPLISHVGRIPTGSKWFLFRKVISMGHKGLRNAGVGGLGSGSDSSSLVLFQGEIE